MHLAVVESCTQRNQPMAFDSRLLFHLAAALLIAIVAILDARRGHERLATTAHSLLPPIDAHPLDAEEPKTARGHFVGAQALLCLQLLLHICHARGRAVVLVVGAAVVEGVVAKVCSPGSSVLL